MTIQIEISLAKSDKETVKSLQHIASLLSKDNIVAFAKKLESNPTKVNSKLPLGLKYI